MSSKKSNRPRLQIIRGLPGSGKTTLALERYPHLLRLETDMYFSRHGEYIFTRELNKKAVAWFENAVFDFAYEKFDFVLTGVFAAHTERLEYCIRQALDFGYDVYIKTLTANHGNVHNVPKAHLDAMKAAFVSESELKKKYRRNTHVHFGLMPRKLNLAQ
jgi:predicted ABC-type ATPase